MKFRLIYSCFAALCLLTISCSKEESEITRTKNAEDVFFIPSYIDAESFQLNLMYSTTSLNNEYSINNFSLKLVADKGDTIKAEGINTSLFKRLANKFGDSLDDLQPHQSFREHPCLLDTINGINILTHKAYDSDHPANSLLNDIITVSFYCPVDFLDKAKRIPGYCNTNPGTCLTKMTLTEFNKQKWHLIGLRNGLRFQLTKEPDQDGEFSFNLIYKGTDSKQKNYHSDSVKIKKL